MSEIRAGDLVVITKPRRCGCDDSIGHIFEVGAVKSTGPGGQCWRCKARTYSAGAIVAHNPTSGCWTEFSRLRRLDPDALKDDIPHRDEVPA